MTTPTDPTKMRKADLLEALAAQRPDSSLKKAQLVKLYNKHIMAAAKAPRKTAAKKGGNTEVPDFIKAMSDSELREAMIKVGLGSKVVNGTTRGIYEKKYMKKIDSDPKLDSPPTSPPPRRKKARATPKKTVTTVITTTTTFSSDDEAPRPAAVVPKRAALKKRATPMKKKAKAPVQSRFSSDSEADNDDELRERLQDYGKIVGPINDTTRPTFVKKLANLDRNPPKATRAEPEPEPETTFGSKWGKQPPVASTEPEPTIDDTESQSEPRSKPQSKSEVTTKEKETPSEPPSRLFWFIVLLLVGGYFYTRIADPGAFPGTAVEVTGDDDGVWEWGYSTCERNWKRESQELKVVDTTICDKLDWDCGLLPANKKAECEAIEHQCNDVAKEAHYKGKEFSHEVIHALCEH